MTVAELIELLKECPQDRMVRLYNDGLCVNVKGLDAEYMDCDTPVVLLLDDFFG